MNDFYFLKSYSKLSVFVEGLENIFKNFSNQHVKDSLLIAVAAFSINRFTDEEFRRLQSNDYFTNIVNVNNKDLNYHFSEISQNYSEIIIFLLAQYDLDKCKIHLYNNQYLLKITFNSNTKDNSIFLLSNVYLNSFLLTNYTFSFISTNTFLENHNKFEFNFFDTNSDSLIKFQPFANKQNYIFSLLACLYTLIAFLLDFRVVFEEDKINVQFADSLKENGYAIIPNFYDPLTIDSIKDITYSLAKIQFESGNAYTYGTNKNLQRIYNLISKHDIYWNLLLDKRVESILEYFFNRNTLHDKYYLSSYQANILYPGADKQILHTDLSMPEPLPPWPVRLNINLTIDEFTIFNGSTLVVPGSHHWLKKPNPLSEDLSLIPLTVPRGSLVVWTGHIWHQSGSNTTDKPRAALLACFAASYLRELAVEENFLAVNSIDTLNRMPRELKTLIGKFHGIKKGA